MMKDNNRFSALCTRAMLLIFAVATLTILTGCAAGRAYDKGLLLDSNGDKERAIMHFQTAVDLAPENVQYKKTLLKAKTERSQYYFQKAQTSRSAKRLASAEKLYVKSTEYNHGNADSIRGLDLVRKEIATSEAIRSEALGLARDKKWDGAVKRMRVAWEQNDELPNGASDLARLLKSAARAHVAIAAKWANEAKWVDVALEANRALKFQPNDADAKALLAEVGRQNRYNALIAEGDGLMEKTKSREALACYFKAKKVNARGRSPARRITKAKVAILRENIREGKKLLGKGEHCAALSLFREGKELVPQDETIIGLVKDTTRMVVRKDLAEAAKSMRSGQLEKAYVHYLLVLGCDEENEFASEGLEDCLVRLREKVTYRVGLLGVKADAKYRQHAERLEAILAEKAMEDLPDYVQFLETHDVVKVLKAQTKATAPRINAMIAAKLLYASLRTKKKRTTGSSKFQKGVRSVKNPNYDKVVAEVQTAQAEYTSAQEARIAANAASNMFGAMAGAAGGGMGDTMGMGATMSAAGSAAERSALSELQSAQIKLRQTPQRISVPNMVTHKYPIIFVTTTANVSARVKIVDTQTKKRHFSGTLHGKWEAHDKYIKEDRARNVPEDLLDIPEPEEMNEHAVASIATQVKVKIAKLIVQHGQNLANDAKRAIKKRDTAAAIRPAVHYLLTYPKGDKHSLEMMNVLQNHIGPMSTVVDLPKLIKKHGRLDW
jgi:tetratricopeptide (TPR) repeat protein